MRPPPHAHIFFSTLTILPAWQLLNSLIQHQLTYKNIFTDSKTGWVNGTSSQIHRKPKPVCLNAKPSNTHRQNPHQVNLTLWGNRLYFQEQIIYLVIQFTKTMSLLPYIKYTLNQPIVRAKLQSFLR